MRRLFKQNQSLFIKCLYVCTYLSRDLVPLEHQQFSPVRPTIATVLQSLEVAISHTSLACPLIPSVVDVQLCQGDIPPRNLQLYLLVAPKLAAAVALAVTVSLAKADLDVQLLSWP